MVVALVAAALWAILAPPGAPPPAIPASIPRGTTGAGEPALGAPGARVVLEEFGDFQCPFCGQFAREIEPQLIRSYVARGTVRLVWHTLAFIGPESVLAGRAAWCAQEQGRFWEYAALLYARQGGENSGAFAAPRLEAIARDAALAPDAFRACVRSDRSLGGIRQGARVARQYGVTATPAFVINGQTATGALSLSQITRLIESALAEGR